MAIKLGSLVVAITGDTKGLEKSVGKARGALNSMARIGVGLPAVLGGAGAAAAGAGLIKIADSYEVMNSRLVYMTGSASAAAEAQEELYKVSKNTGTSLQENSKSFLKLEQAASLTGLSTQQNISVLETINTLMIATGTEGQEAASAMLQFGQALTSGKLAGDEFKSLAENAPGFLKALGDAMGYPYEEMKTLAANGELTSEKIGAALLEMSENATVSFEDLPKTAQKGWNSVVLAFEKAWDKINDENGIMAELYLGLENVATWIEDNTYLIEEWVTEGWGKFVEAIPKIQAGFSKLVTFFTGLYNLVAKAIAGWEKLIEVYNYWKTIIGAGDDLYAQRKFVDDIIREEYPDEQTVRSSSSASGGGASIVNNFSQQLSKNDITDITTNQKRLVARL